MTSRTERPLVRLVGSEGLNPLPHTGTISLFLLVVVTISGLYLMLFFRFGFEASYGAVAALEAHPIQRFARALHRYASAALVVTALTHGWRTMVAGRFSGPRWWPWATGVFSLLVIWVAGVSGYWLIWDERVTVLNEALIRLLASTRRGTDFVIDFLVGPAAGSGWLVLLIVLTIHVLATAVLGFALWYHVRRTRHALLPPRVWMVLIGAVLGALSLAVPAGMLDPADPTRLMGPVPIDPFYLFLLPAVLAWSPWLVALVGGVIGAIATALPLATRRVGVVELDAEACTGCELCVFDCPYEALAMVEAEDRPIVAIDAGRCVACGICIGSCSFGALRLSGVAAPALPADVGATPVTITCSRHLEAATSRATDGVFVDVPCSGMLHPRVVSGLFRQGAASVHVVGCPPGDCSYGIGNTVLHDRLSGGRSPMLPPRWQGLASEDWVAPAALQAALASPGRHPTPRVDRVPLSRRQAVAALFVVLATFGAVVALTNVDYGSPAEQAALQVVVDHVPGHRLRGADDPGGTPGIAPAIQVYVDGAVALDEEIALVPADAGATALLLTRLDLEPGSHQVRAVLDGGNGAATVLVDERLEVVAGDLVTIGAVDAPPDPTALAGRSLFTEATIGMNAGCSICHSLSADERLVGPPLGNIGLVAETRIPGMDAATYLYQSIVDPDAHVVAGYRPGQMLPDYGSRLAPEQIDALVSFMLSLRGDGS